VDTSAVVCCELCESDGERPLTAGRIEVGVIGSFGADVSDAPAFVKLTPPA
jgi:hypothetical protein